MRIHRCVRGEKVQCFSRDSLHCISSWNLSRHEQISALGGQLVVGGKVVQRLSKWQIVSLPHDIGELGKSERFPKWIAAQQVDIVRNLFKHPIVTDWP